MVTELIAAEAAPDSVDRWWLPRTRFDAFLGALSADGRRVVGPTVRDGAIVMDDIERAEALPVGLTLLGSPGRVRVQPLPDGPGNARAFQYTVSGDGFKRFTFPSRIESLSTDIAPDGSVRIRVEVPTDEPRVAVLGARACDLAGLAVHDGVLMGGPAVDPDYQARRAGLLVVAVECAVATSTCFCRTMGTGPEIESGADLILNELDDGFIVRAPTPAGRSILETLDLAVADADGVTRAAAEVAATRASMPEQAIPSDSRDLLLANLDHPRWARSPSGASPAPTARSSARPASAPRGQETDLSTGRKASHHADVGQLLQPASPRSRAAASGPAEDRYRQWLTHKFATWWDQFGTSGCVGCGRCITWCPVGIDVRRIDGGQRDLRRPVPPTSIRRCGRAVATDSERSGGSPTRPAVRCRRPVCRPCDRQPDHRRARTARRPRTPRRSA